MKKSRFTEEQIIGVLREHEAGVKTADVCRKHGISAATFFKWKSKYGGMDVSDARRLFPLCLGSPLPTAGLISDPVVMPAGSRHPSLKVQFAVARAAAVMDPGFRRGDGEV